MSRRLTVGPFNRVEGDLEVHLNVEGDAVRSARVGASMYRGFEEILKGREPYDALVVAPRICGICSVSQSLAAAFALGDIAGEKAPANGRHALNLMLATENTGDHVTHFYLHFMPDLANPAYTSRPWYPYAVERFKAGRGEALEEVIPARARFFHMMGLLAGKWPHSLSLLPGGSARALVSGEVTRLFTITARFKRFLEKTLFGATLAEIAGLSSLSDLNAWADKRPPGSSDFRFFLEVAKDLGFMELGKGGDLFMSYGNFPTGDGTRQLKPGLWDRGERRDIDLSKVREDTAHSWFAGDDALHPQQGRTEPDAERDKAYSWAKAPRLAGRPVEVGALPRQLIDGHPLAIDLMNRGGANVFSRTVCRLVEAARLMLMMEDWIGAIKPGEPFFVDTAIPSTGSGVGLVEAARGGLGHWITIEKDAIANYQVISPTTWNFSPRDKDDVPGPLESALVGAPILQSETTPVSVQHVIRSFDPCMVCTVH